MTDDEDKRGHNSELTDEQKQALFHHHTRLYKDALAKKKAADADFKNACKRAKAESVDPKMIKFAIELEGDEDGHLEAERKERERIAQWLGLPFGGQSDMFDRRTAAEIAFDAGKRAGMEGKSGSAPDGYDPVEWSRGWQAGQAALISSLELFRTTDDAQLIPNSGRELEEDEFDDALDREDA